MEWRPGKHGFKVDLVVNQSPTYREEECEIKEKPDFLAVATEKGRAQSTTIRST